MEIAFGKPRVQKLCESHDSLVRAYGTEGAKKVGLRLADLRAAGTLEDMRELPGHCEELKGDREGEISLRLDGSRRLIFEPTQNPVPLKADGGLDRTKVTAIRILEIADYH